MEEALNSLPDLSSEACTDENIITRFAQSLRNLRKRGSPSPEYPWEFSFPTKINEQHMVGLLQKVYEHYKGQGIQMDIRHKCTPHLFTVYIDHIRTVAEVEAKKN